MEVSGQPHASDTHWIGGWAALRAGLDAVEKRKTLTPVGNRTREVQLVAIPNEQPQLFNKPAYVALLFYTYLTINNTNN
jgi:hypothetical protein